MPTLIQIIESIIFVAQEPLSQGEILDILNKGEADKADMPETVQTYTITDVDAALEALVEKYQDESFVFELRNIAQGYQFLTKKAFFPYIKQASLENNKKRLSRAALETLSIIAYRQPVTKSEIEFIRGVNSDYATQKLLDKKLIAIVGRSEGPGRPLLYGTSTFFMQYFGISDMEALPKLKEFEELEETHLEKFKQFQEEKNEAGNASPKVNDDGKTEAPNAEENE